MVTRETPAGMIFRHKHMPFKAVTSDRVRAEMGVWTTRLNSFTAGTEGEFLNNFRDFQ